MGDTIHHTTRTRATFENLFDVLSCLQGDIFPDQIRRAEFAEAVVDMDATLVALPASTIRQLGLWRVGTRSVNTGYAYVKADLYAAVRLTINGRSCTMDVLEQPDGSPVVIGRIPLLALDLIAYSESGRLVLHPMHGEDVLLEL